jgi:glyoxylase-like metal-dependent hydrolase (beta-lactamase superfamily II)
MLIAGFPAGTFAANCYAVAAGPGEECLIVDPGQDAEPGIEEIIRRYRLKPVAVLLTHGHIDHIWSVAPVCGARNIPAYIHPADRALLTDPASGLWPQAAQAGSALFGGLTFTEPDEVAELTDGATLLLAGLEVVVDHAPGHTPGSVTFRLPGVCGPLSGDQGSGDQGGGDQGGGDQGGGDHGAGDPVGDPGVLFSGDLLFAGSIGRSDLPGGDYATIMDSLARVCLPLPDETVVLAGHGPQTTIGAERAANPFLAGLTPAPAPGRGPGSRCARGL